MTMINNNGIRSVPISNNEVCNSDNDSNINYNVNNNANKNNNNNNNANDTINYIITGKAAHERLVPLLPKSWIDCTTNLPSSTTTTATTISINDNNSSSSSIDFLWENAPRKNTIKIRNNVSVYSHLPNGISILDDKWVLSRLFSLSLEEEEMKTKKTKNSYDNDTFNNNNNVLNKEQDNDDNEVVKEASILESQVFRGINGYIKFCHEVGLLPSSHNANNNINNSKNRKMATITTTKSKKNQNKQDPKLT